MDKIYNKFTGIGWISKISKFKETKNGNKYITFNFVFCLHTYALVRT